MILILPVEGFPDYVVTDEGRIYKMLEVGMVEVLSNPNHGGYRIVRLKKGNKWYNRRVHVLVWTSFIGPIPYGYQVNHIKGFKWLNGLQELNLMTQEENLKHSRETGLRAKPKFETKLDDITVLTLYTLKHQAKRQDLVKYTGTSIRNVEMILSGQTWNKLFTLVTE